MPNHEERAYHIGQAIIETFDLPYWREQASMLFRDDPKDHRVLSRLSFKLFVNTHYRWGMTQREALPFQQAYRSYRNRLFGPTGWDDQLTPPGLSEIG